MEFNIEYDPTKLRFTEVKDFNLQDLSASSFGLPGVGANQEGAIKLSWFDQAASGVTVADGTEIFVMCFEVIGTGTTDVGVVSNGLEIIDSGAEDGIQNLEDWMNLPALAESVKAQIRAAVQQELAGGTATGLQASLDADVVKIKVGVAHIVGQKL